MFSFSLSKIIELLSHITLFSNYYLASESRFLDFEKLFANQQYPDLSPGVTIPPDSYITET